MVKNKTSVRREKRVARDMKKVHKFNFQHWRYYEDTVSTAVPDFGFKTGIHRHGHSFSREVRNPH